MRNVKTMLICSMLLSAAVGMAADAAGQGGDRVAHDAGKKHDGHDGKKAHPAKKKEEPKKEEHNKEHNKEHKK